MRTIFTFRAASCALIAGILTIAPYSFAFSDVVPPEIASSTAASGTPPAKNVTKNLKRKSEALSENGSVDATIEASFTQNGLTGTWQAHASGSYGPDVLIKELYMYGEDAEGNILTTLPLGYGTAIKDLPTGFRFSLEVPKPGSDWAYIGLKMQVTDSRGLWHDVYSEPFPAIWEQPVLVEHLQGGSVVEPSNYVPGGIPAGVGIPYSFLAGLERGYYYAVVFFDGISGCPSANYRINAFVPGQVWDEDHIGGGYHKARGTEGGGCMEEFDIKSRGKGSEWLWGALDPNGSAAAAADASGVPAFAICGTEEACAELSVRTEAPEASEQPEASSTDPSLVSSVLFLPGIKGSRLYEENPLCLIPTDSCDIPMWLPLADAATPGLYMNPLGKSRKNLYTHEGDILSEAFGREFYASFSRTLDDAQEDGSFGKGWGWQPVAYDWRMSLPDLVHNGVQEGSRIYYENPADLPYIEESLRTLASSSPTGKVAIVAHSNGGLVAKALMQELGDTETSRLVDSVVFVGVPQSGAPRALGALLYGDGEGIPGIKNVPNVIMSAAHAREFARTSPMAYHLLPSAAYMAAKNLSYPLVKFEDSPLFAVARARYGETIDTAAELRDYAMGGDGRSVPAVEDLASPALLTRHLLDYAAAEHETLDAWEPPEGVEVYEVGGHSVPTISGIAMYEAPTEEGPARRAYRPLFSFDGDGTVPVISSLMMNSGERVHALWADLESIDSSGQRFGHANLLEAPAVQETVANILRGTSKLPPHISAAAPQGGSGSSRLAFFLHSPASLSVADGQGNRTEVNGDAVPHEDIPGSTAGTFGEVSYVLVPADAPYTLTLDGQASGTFTLDIQELEGAAVTASSTFAEMPVTSSMLATLSVDEHVASTSPLAVDEDGDGTVEFYVSPKLGAVSFPSDRVEAPAPTEIPGPDDGASDEESPASDEPSRGRSRRSEARGTFEDGLEGAPTVLREVNTIKGIVAGTSTHAVLEKVRLEQRAPEPTGTVLGTSAGYASPYEKVSTVSAGSSAEPPESTALTEAAEDPHISFMQRLLRFLMKVALTMRHLVSPLIP